MKYLYLLIALLFSSSTWALNAEESKVLEDIQKRWAEIQYQTVEQECCSVSDQKAVAFEKLAAETQRFTQKSPTAAEAWIWHGIVTSSWAGASGGLGALGKVKEARASLEKALTLDPQALQGSAYTSLGALYDQVPGWPVGFGDSDKAAEMFSKALAINPNGIDSLYFWGDHLFREERYDEAKTALQKALQAPPRPGREVADQGRRSEIQALLKDIQEEQD